LLSFLFVVVLPVSSFDLWQYSVAADKGTIFAGVFAANFAFDFNNPPDSKFSFDHPDFYIDYILPVGLPFSLGLSLDSLHTDQYGFGVRPGYHINFDVPNLDIYIMYTTDVDISKTKMVLDHGVRLGLRYVFNDLFCVCVETGYRFERLLFGVSVKLN
jgi:hypothetical protein